MARYDRLIEWLGLHQCDEVSASLAELDAVLDTPLTFSARHQPPFWASGSHVGKQLVRAGWKATPRLQKGSILFRRITAANAPTGVVQSSTVSTQTSPRSKPEHPLDLVLIGCVKEKRSGMHPARELYLSTLFEGRRARAESAGCPWFILSAQYGLVHPDEQIATYDLELKSLPADARRRWSKNVLESLKTQFGSVQGKRIEIHAGAAYRDNGVVQGLRAQGAEVIVPLEGLSFGQQLAHYASDDAEGIAASRVGAAKKSPVVMAQMDIDAGKIVSQITGDFTHGHLQLTARLGAPTPGWDVLPECEAAAKLRERGCDDAGVRKFLTLVAALDRAREANQLWRAATELHAVAPWAFDPEEVVHESLNALRDHLAKFGVSRRHGPDTAAWRLICEALTMPDAPRAVAAAIREGQAEAHILAEALQGRTPSGHAWYPFLSGPKVSAMWVRMLVVPGSANITGLESVPVAVDTQVRKVTEYLGLTNTRGQSLDDARAIIQEAWATGAERAEGPKPLLGTAAAIDPAVWFFGKWGCSHCERVGRRSPISRVCEGCRMN